MSKVLEMVFQMSDSTKKTVKINEPLSNLTLSQLQTAATPFIAAKLVASSSSHALAVSFDSGRYVETTITDIVD